MEQGEYGFSYGDPRASSALVVAASASGGAAARRALDHAGVRVAREIGFADARDALREQAAAQLIVIEAAEADERLAEIVFSEAAERMRTDDVALVVSVGDTQIDLAAAHLMRRGAQILCAPTDVERLTAVIAAVSRSRTSVNDSGRDAESVRLRRLHEEVARIADTLAQLTRNEEMAPLRQEWDGSSGDAKGAETQIAAQDVRAVIRARRMRAQFFQAELFADPAWDMLLDLFAADLESRRVSVSSLCIAAAVPPTTALRWISTMHDAGLFERHADPSDRRRAYIALSGKGLEAMRSYATAVTRQGLSLV